MRAGFCASRGVHTINDLERIKEKVLAKESPWIDGWNLMIQDSKAQYTYKAAPAESVSGPSGRRQRAARDGVAAYYNFLRWYVTGDERHAQCAVDILNAWSSSVDDVITGELSVLIPDGKKKTSNALRRCVRSIFIRPAGTSWESVAVGPVGTALPIHAIWLSAYSVTMKPFTMKLWNITSLVAEEDA